MMRASTISGMAIFFLLLHPALAEPMAHSLGVPVRSMSIRSSLLVIDPVTGRPTFYSGMFTSTGTARLIRFDYAVGKVEYYELPGAKGVYGLAEGPDGRIYAGSILPARIFSFDPVSKDVTDHGSAAGEQYIFELCLGPDGRIYGGTYPGAKVVAYDPSSGRIENLGSMHPTEQYVGDLTVAGNGRVFAGIFPNADLVVYDPKTREKRSILPKEYSNATGVDPDSEEGLVFASVEGKLLIFDADTYELVDKVIHPEGGWVGTHRPISGGPLIIHGLPGGYVRYNRSTGSLEPYYTPRISTYDNASKVFSTYDNASKVAFIRAGGRQIFQAYNLSSGELLAEYDVSGDGEGMSVFSLATGPEGCIYGGSVSLLHLFKYDPVTGILQNLGFPYPGGGGEFYSLHTHGEKLYMAAYSGSVLGVYQPSAPWKPGTGPGSNPREIGSVGEEQNRPHALTSSADGRIFVGSEPDYGRYGGALSIYDPSTDAFEVHRDIVPNQSILSLTASADGWTIYGGSSTRGGTGTEPITRRGHFFAWDVKLGEKTLDIVPAVASDEISSLVTGPDGLIYGCADSTLFVFDPERREIIHTQGTGEGEIESMVVGTDGLIYGRSENAIFRMKPLSGIDGQVRFELLYRGQEGRGIALDFAGRVYFGQGPELYVIESLPEHDPPTENLPIYGDGLWEGWQLLSSGAEVSLASTEAVASGTCQKITYDRFCTLQYEPPDPWDITLWEYDYLAFSVNPGESSITSIVVTKTGPGSTASLEVLDRYDVDLSPNEWTDFTIPVEDLDWAFGSRLESLKFIVLGAGTFYLDSLQLRVDEVGCLSATVFFIIYLSRTHSV